MQRWSLLLTLLGSAAFFLPPHSQAQTHQAPLAPLTLQQAIDKAQQYNPGLAVTAREMDIADAGVEQSKLLPNPELEVLSEGLDEKTQAITVQIKQVIELGGKRSSRISAAERDKDVAVAELAIQREALRADVTAAYFDVFVAQERAKIADASYQLATKINEIANRRVTAGRISPIEATRTSVAELSIRNEWTQAKADLTLAKGKLAAFWGESTPAFTKVGEFAQVSVAGDELGALQARLKNSPRLMKAQVEIDRQLAQLEVARSRRIGDVTVSIGNKREQDLGTNKTVVGITVPLPLFDRNQGNVLGALRKTDQARDELNALESRLRSDLAQAHQRYLSSKEELSLLQTKILPQAESIVTALTKGFEFGKFNLLDVLEAQRTLFKTKLQYLEALAGYLRSVTDIERIVGTEKLLEVQK